MVKLSVIKDALEDVDMDSTCYFNKETNEILWQWGFNEEYSTYKEEDEANDNIICMFDYFSKNDYDIMQDFIDTIEDINLREKLYDATRGRGAFSRFRYIVESSDLLEEWYKYKDEKYKVIAKEWCIDNNIEFEDDC